MATKAANRSVMESSDIDRVIARRLRESYDAMLLPAPSAGLAGADCGTTAKRIAHLAAAAAELGSSEADWRLWMYRRFPLLAGRRLEEAVTCMQQAGLWPWRVAST